MEVNCPTMNEWTEVRLNMKWLYEDTDDFTNWRPEGSDEEKDIKQLWNALAKEVSCWKPTVHPTLLLVVGGGDPPGGYKNPTGVLSGCIAERVKCQKNPCPGRKDVKILQYNEGELGRFPLRMSKGVEFMQKILAEMVATKKEQSTVVVMNCVTGTRHPGIIRFSQAMEGVYLSSYSLQDSGLISEVIQFREKIFRRVEVERKIDLKDGLPIDSDIFQNYRKEMPAKP